MGGGLSFIYNKAFKDFSNTHIYHCTFVNNTAKTAGAVIFHSLANKNSSIIVEDCKFYYNNAVIHGGAAHVTSYNFIGTANPIQFINWLVCITYNIMINLYLYM